ncbi:hypothetical protein ACJ41O_010050 [Fusarium nematophilum]
MASRQARIVFEYPRFGPGVISQSPPAISGFVAPSDLSVLEPDPEFCPFSDSDSYDSEDYDSDEPDSEDSDEEEQDKWAAEFLKRIDRLRQSPQLLHEARLRKGARLREMARAQRLAEAEREAQRAMRAREEMQAQDEDQPQAGKPAEPQNLVRLQTLAESQDEDGSGEPAWRPHAHLFLSQIPQDESTWSRHLLTNAEVRSLCNRIASPTSPFINPNHGGGGRSWSSLFTQCIFFLACASFHPPLASLFSVILVAACHVALVSGCPKHIVSQTLKECVSQCGVREAEVSDAMVDKVREGVIAGIDVLSEYARVIGPRANEIPLHASGFLRMAQHCTPSCRSYIKAHILSTYRPRTLAHDSEYLEIPALVYELFGGEKSAWKYEDISRILHPNAYKMPIYKSIQMRLVLEYEEESEDEEDAQKLPGLVRLFRVHSM